MNSRFRPTTFRSSTPILLASVLLSISAFTALADNNAPAQKAKTPADIQATYERDRARCLSGQSQEDQATCLKEAGAARDAAVKGQLSDGDGKLRKNARDRCDALSGDDRRDCIARVKDAPNTTESGSVKGGGILRETVTIETGTPASAPAR